ncbi:lasso RiPP family leader peptide-containing protein [Streptomyces sp. NPDC059649]|uniref:lasso RiPP family leader peptide-containing protein n=1 Tax=Streptomyces sp. NPDC059649 TaxID=3346895 RepID=UPI0036C0C794
MQDVPDMQHVQDVREMQPVPAVADALTTDYEAPQLVEVGDFTKLTLGYSGLYRDGWGAFFGLP